MIINNLLVILRMLFDYQLYRFILRLSKIEKKPRGLFTYFKYLAKFCQGDKIIYCNQQYIINSFVPPLFSEACFTWFNSLNANKDFLTAFNQGDPTAPISTYLKITNQCDCSCLYCSANCHNSSTKTTQRKLSLNDWKRVIGELQDLGVSYLGFTGGEPLLHPDIEELVSTIDHRSVSVLFTNGIHLTYEKARSLKEAGLFAISISLDSADEQKHNQTRGNPLAFKSALQAITNAKKVGLYTIVQPVLFKSDLTWHNLDQLLRLAKKHGAHEVRIHKPALSGKFLSAAARNQLAFDQDDCKKLYSLQFKANRKLFGMPKVSSFPYTEGPERFGCNAGIFHSYITDEGELTPCDFVPLTFGNVLDHKIDKLYKTMKEAMGTRKMSCMSAQVAPYLTQELQSPSPDESITICQKICASTKEVPKFFKETAKLL